jgi:hypothetical protein
MLWGGVFLIALSDSEDHSWVDSFSRPVRRYLVSVLRSHIMSTDGRPGYSIWILVYQNDSRLCVFTHYL